MILLISTVLITMIIIEESKAFVTTRSPYIGSTQRLKRVHSNLFQVKVSQGSTEPENPVKNKGIHPTATDCARTVAHICCSGTLCTTSIVKEVEGYPYGSYVDYILDSKGWPVLLLNEHSMHTQNIKTNPAVSLFCQSSKERSSPALSSLAPNMITSNAGLSRVTIMGKIQSIPSDELIALKFAFILVHGYSEQIADSPKFHFYRIQPEKIYFTGGYGVMSTWINIPEYEQAKPDVIAQEVSTVLSRINLEKQNELMLMVKHFLGGLDQVQSIQIQSIDQLGIDLRVKKGKILYIECFSYSDVLFVFCYHSAVFVR
jgi:putative heme iron utilization protein